MNYDGPSFYKKDSKKNDDKSIQSDFNQGKNHRQIEKKAKAYLSTPLNYSKIESVAPLIKSKKRNQSFRSKQIPQSLQKLDGWKKTDWKQDLLVELEKRLMKNKEDYLLFAQDSQPNKEEKNKSNHPGKKTNPSFAQNVSSQEKIAKAHRELKNDIIKSTSGLHRSLSKIISEDEKALKKGKNNLESFFNDSKKQG